MEFCYVEKSGSFSKMTQIENECAIIAPLKQRKPPLGEAKKSSSAGAGKTE